MESSKKILLSTIGIAVMIVALTGITFSFFNYTRTGASNVVRTGRIYFNSSQNGNINLTNAFPIDKANINSDTNNVGSVSIHVTGDTTYTGGIEYLISAANVNNKVNLKQIPINIEVSYEATEDKAIGIEDEEYFTNRGGNQSLYKIIRKKVADDGDKLVVGYIKPDAEGIDGTITIKAYIDKDQIAISDTYPNQILYSLNENMTEEELNLCINKLKTYYRSETDETIEAFCLGTGKISDKTIVEDVTSGHYGRYYRQYMIDNNIIHTTENGTDDEWLKGRVLLTTEEWNSLQENGISFKVKVEANEDVWVEAKQNVNVMGTFPKTITDETDNIKEIYFNNMNKELMEARYNAATIKADITDYVNSRNDGKVLAWLETNATDNTKYTMYVVSNGETYLSVGEYLFKDWKGTEKIQFNNANTSMLSNMHGMFYGNQSLKSVNVKDLDISNVSNISDMFYNNSSLESIDLSNWGGDNLTQIYPLFSSCPNLREINASGFNFGNASYIGSLFGYLSNLTTINLSNADMSNITSLNSLFSGDTSLTNVNLSNISMENVTNISSMFYNCSSLESIDLSNLGSDVLTNTSSLFYNCNNLKTINMQGFDFGNVNFGSGNNYYAFAYLQNVETIDLTNADTSGVTNMNSLFNGCKKLVEIDLSSLDTSNVTDMRYMFYGCEKLVNVNLSGLGGDNLTNVTELFAHCSSLENVDMSNFNFGQTTDLGGNYSPFCSSYDVKNVNLSNANFKNVTGLRYMFGYAGNLESIDFTNANMSKVTDMSYMFQNCSKLKEVIFKNVETPNVTKMNCMFYNCDGLISINLSGLGSNRLINMDDMFYQSDGLISINMQGFIFGNTAERIFIYATNLETIDLTDAYMDNLVNTKEMFSYNSKLTTIYVSDSWNLDAVTNSNNMFFGCTSLVGGNGTVYDSTKVDKTMAVIDTVDHPGYLTLKTA